MRVQSGNRVEIELKLELQDCKVALTSHHSMQPRVDYNTGIKASL